MRARMSLELVAHLCAAIDAEAEGEAAPLAAVDADGLEHRRVEHPAAAEFDPPAEGAGATSRTATDRAGDLELGRRLGEGEVARAQSRGDVGTEVRAGEGLDDAREVPERDAAIDDQSLDLMKRREVARVGRVAAISSAPA